MMKKNKSGATDKGLKDKDKTQQQSTTNRRVKKLSEYGKQLYEKQHVKRMYGLRERQFRNLFEAAKKSKDATGSALLVLLERRLDNVVYRLKLAKTRSQARQLVVHGHVTINEKRVSSPSCLVKVGDVVKLSKKSSDKSGLIDEVVGKALAGNKKVSEWLESDHSAYLGKILRMPVREDIQATINENYIVELYSK